MPVTLDNASSTHAQELVPRRYQTEIYLQAQKGNVITVMDTGSGKTLIAVTLIKWITSRLTESPSATRKAVIFLVPKVPLVDQQQAVITSQTSLRVRGYVGEMNVDYWERAKWEQEFAEADVLVMTAQILYDLLSHAHWSMDRISLLIFDEAHHCRKNHPYAQIMRDHYYKCDASKRPKVFGMTASPIWNLKQPLVALKELEQNMNSKVLAVRDNVEELQKHAPKPREIIVTYPPTPTAFTSYTFPVLWDHLTSEGLMQVDGLNAESIRTKYEFAKDSLGIYGSEYYLHALVPTALQSLLHNKRKEAARTARIGSYSTHRMRSSASPVGAGMTAGDATGEDEQIARLERLREVLAKHSAHFSPPLPEIDSDWLSPRLRKLIEVLQSHFTDDPTCQAILFADQRHIVAALAWILPNVPGLKGVILAASLVGHGGRGSGDLFTDSTGMNIEMQRQAVKSFRDRTVNLLVATSVAEEGLDFQPCNLVVRWDPLQTMVSYAQSRGRARHKVSTYVIMHTEGSATIRTKYNMFAAAEPDLKQAYQTRIAKDAVDEEEEEEPVSFGDLQLREQYRSSTGAVLTYSSSIALLAMLCAVLRTDDFTPALKPVYKEEGAYSYSLQLPSALPLPRPALSYTGPTRSNKKEAKRAVAFKAVRALHKLGCYDDWLLPTRGSSELEGEDADGEVFVPLEIPATMETTVLDVWGDPWKECSQLWCYPIFLGDIAYAGLVTSAMLDAGDVNDHSNSKMKWPNIGEGVPLTFSSEEERLESLALMEGYTLFGKAWAVSRRPVKDRLACFFTPLSGEGLPDYSAMQSALAQPLSSNWSGMSECEGDILVAEKKTSARPYLLIRFRHDVTPSTPYASLGMKCCEKECLNFLDHERSVLAAESEKQEQAIARGKKVEATKRGFYPPLTRDEPMVEIQIARMNQHPKAGQIELVPLSYVKWIALPLEVFHAFETLPLLTRHIAFTYRARAAQQLLQLPKYPLGFFVEALSMPSAVPDCNYNRLETLGDTFVKLATSIHIFNKFPHRHEGQLSALKDNSVRNLYLRGKSFRLGLHHYAICERVLAKRRWVPPNVQETVFKEGIAYVQRKVPRRFLPDCVEALLGASYLNGGMQAVLRAGTSMGLCFGGTEAWTSRYRAYEDFGYSMPPGLKPLEDSLGYKFRNPALLLEAVTHPTFTASETPSYNRLEFLGDCLIDAHVLEYVFRKFPTATAHQLTWMKHMLVCNPILGTLAVRRLSLQKYLLAFSPFLDASIAVALRDLEKWTYESLVLKWWEFSPPKVLNDLLEAVLGAVLVDSNYDMDAVRTVIEPVFEEILGLARPDLPKHPVLELMLWTSKNGCIKTRYNKSKRGAESHGNDTYSVLVHGVEVSSSSKDGIRIAKCFAASDARVLLSDPEGEFALHKLCTCPAEREEEARLRAEEKAEKARQKEQAEHEQGQATDVEMEDAEATNAAEEMEVEQIVQAYLETDMEIDVAMDGAQDETEEGFASAGRALLKAFEPETAVDMMEDETDNHALEEQEDEEL